MTTHIHTIDDGARVTVSEHDGLVSLLVDHGHLALAAYLTAAQARTVAATLNAYADALDGEDPEIRAATGGSGDETGAPAPVQPGNGTEPHSAPDEADTPIAPLTSSERNALARELVLQRLDHPDEWINWEQVPLLSEDSHRLVVERVSDICRRLSDHYATIDALHDVDGAELLRRVQ